MLKNNDIEFGVLLDGKGKLPIYFESIKCKYNEGRMMDFTRRIHDLEILFSNYVDTDNSRNNIDIENMLIVFGVYKMRIDLYRKAKDGKFGIILEIGSNKFINNHSLLQLGYLRPVDFYRKVAEIFLGIVNDLTYANTSHFFNEEESNTMVEVN